MAEIAANYKRKGSDLIMAKLNGVKTVDMVNGEITKVSYGGTEYVADGKLNGGKTDVGNLLRYNGGGGVDVTVGAFYEVKYNRNDAIYDDVNDNPYLPSCMDFTIFRKISLQTPSPTIEERVDKLEAEVEAMKGEQQSVEIEFVGAKYRKVEAEQSSYVPQEGDIVVITANTTASRNAVGDVGKVGKVTSWDATIDVPGKTEGNGNWSTFDEIRKATPAEVAAYEKAAHKASFSVGDYVKIVKSERGNNGAICVIREIDESSIPVKLRHISGKFPETTSWATYNQIVKATEQEVADASKPKLKAGDYVKFKRSIADTKAGKPYKIEYYGAKGKLAFKDDAGDWCSIERTGDYEIVDAPSPEKPTLKAGDFVKFTKYNSDEFSSSDITLGKAYQVITDRCGDLAFLDDDNDERNAPLDCPDCYEIIPADEAKIARKPGEFKKGDIVRLKQQTTARLVEGSIGEVVADCYDNYPLVKGVTESGEIDTYFAYCDVIIPVKSLTK